MATEEIEAPEEKQTERTFSQADVDRLIDKRVKSMHKELEARPTSDQLAELQAKLDGIESERELAGKTAAEKLTHQHAKELEKISQQYAKLEESMKAKESEAVESQAQLKNFRLQSAFSAALNKAGVYSPGASDALKVLLAEITEPEFGDTGIRASYGDEIDEPPEEIAKKFLEDRPHFASAKVGGAGTTRPSGAPHAKNLDDMGVDELWAAAGPDPSATDNQH
jgi:hypothetical protein